MTATLTNQTKNTATLANVTLNTAALANTSFASLYLNTEALFHLITESGNSLIAEAYNRITPINAPLS